MGRNLVFMTCALLGFSPSAGNAALKPEMRGLVAMGSVADILRAQDGCGKGNPSANLDDVFAKPEAFGGVVFNLSWDQLEPERGRLDTAVIDEQLARVRAHNREHPSAPLSVRLRVLCGTAAPPWAKRLGGDPVEIVNSKQQSVTVGRFWTKDYREAWRVFQESLAAKYDGEPLIVDVQVTSGMTNTGELLNLAHTPSAIANLRAAGFTDALFKDILENSGADYAAWQTTRLTFVFNPYKGIDSGKAVPDEAYTIRLMKLCREKHGARAILSDHSLQHPHAEGRGFLYDALVSLGPPINFQTHAPKDIDMEATIANAVSMGAGSVEIWNGTPGGFANRPLSELLKWKALFG